MLTQAPKGTQDMLPNDAHRWQKIEAAMRSVCALAGYREIRTPMFEHTELFARGVGDGTDVVQKGDVHLGDGRRALHHLARGHGGVARAFIEHHLFAELSSVSASSITSPPPTSAMRSRRRGGCASSTRTAWRSLALRTPRGRAEIIALALDVLRAWHRG